MTRQKQKKRRKKYTQSQFTYIRKEEKKPGIIKARLIFNNTP